MAFTLQELDNISNSSLDYYMDRGTVFANTIQEKPLLRELRKWQKEFPGGKENISVGVKGQYTTTIQGFTHNDQINYGNPANTKRAYYPWKELSWGIEVTLTELKKDGISITDTTNGTGEEKHSERELTAIANILEEKMDDMSEGSAIGLNSMYWQDGTQDAKEIPGIKSIIVDSPSTSGVIGGLDPVANSWWRNRSNLTISVGSTPANQVLINFLQTEMRQLRRYARDAKHVALCGADFLDQLEAEVRAKGDYTLSGWADKGSIDISMDAIKIKKMVFEYDPSLDDMGEADRCYIIDFNAIIPMVMTGEDMKKHNPARPHDRYAIYKAVTYTGGLVARQRNSSGVYKIV